MAKARTSDIAATATVAGDHPAHGQFTTNPNGDATRLSQGSRVVLIEIPLTETSPPTEFVFHVDCKLTPQQSTVARRLAQQLDFQNARLENGQRIVNVHGAIKWLLEEIASKLIT